jgi:hypothetical protein
MQHPTRRRRTLLNRRSEYGPKTYFSDNEVERFAGTVPSVSVATFERKLTPTYLVSSS